MSKTKNPTFAEMSDTIFWMTTLLYRGTLTEEFAEALQVERHKAVEQERRILEGLSTLAQYRHQIERTKRIVSAAGEIRGKVSENAKWYKKRLKKFERWMNAERDMPPLEH